MLESEQQQQLTDDRSLGGCQDSTPVTAQQQQLAFLVTAQQPLPSVSHVIGQQQSVQNQNCYMSPGQVTGTLNCVPSPIPSRTTPSTPRTHSSAISSPSPLPVQSANGGQSSVQLQGTTSCPPQSLSISASLPSTRVNAPSPSQTSSHAAVIIPHFQRQHSVSFTPSSGSHAEHLQSTISRSCDGEYDNIHQQQSVMCDASSQLMHHSLQLQQARQQHILQSPRMQQQQQQQQQQKYLKQPTTLSQGQHQNLQLRQNILLQQQQHCQQQQMLQQHCQQPQILQQQQLQMLQKPQQQQNFQHQWQTVQQKQQVQAHQIQQSQHGCVQFSLQKQLKKHFIQQRDDGDEEDEEDILQRPLTAKEEYRELKHRFKFLVYENECYQEELRNLQRKLLKLSRDKNFLLDRLLLYEKLSDSSDESDSSVKTIEEKIPPKKKSRLPTSRRRSTNAKVKGTNNVSCMDSDVAKILLTEEQQQHIQKQPLQQSLEQQHLSVQNTDSTTNISVSVCSASDMGIGEQRVTIPISACLSERNMKKEEAVINTQITENEVFEENRSSQFSSSAFTSPR